MSRSFAPRVARDAFAGAADASGPPAASRISARRVENSRRCSSAKPSISAMPLRTSCHSTPRLWSARGAGSPHRRSRRFLGGVDSRVEEAGPTAIGPGSRWRRGHGRAVAGRRCARSGGRGGGEEAAAFDELRAAGAAPRPARLALHVVEGGVDGAVVASMTAPPTSGPLSAQVARRTWEPRTSGRSRGPVLGRARPGGRAAASRRGDFGPSASPGAGRRRPRRKGPARLRRRPSTARRPRPPPSSSPPRLRRPSPGSTSPGGSELADGKHARSVHGGGALPRSLREVIVREGFCCWLLGLELGTGPGAAPAAFVLLVPAGLRSFLLLGLGSSLLLALLVRFRE